MAFADNQFGYDRIEDGMSNDEDLDSPAQDIEEADLSSDDELDLSQDIQSGKKKTHMKRPVIFKVFLPLEKYKTDVEEVICIVYSPRKSDKLKKKHKLSLKPNPICPFVWESQPVQCKMKRLKYGYKVKQHGQTDKQGKEYLHSLDMHRGECFDTFFSGDEQALNDVTIGVILSKIIQLQEKDKSVAKACIESRLFVKNCPKEKIVKLFEDLLKSPNLKVKQAEAVIILLGCIIKPDTFDPFVESLESNLLPTESTLSILGLSVQFLTKIDHIEFLHKYICSCKQLKEECQIIANALDHQLQVVIKHSSLWKELQSCLNVMLEQLYSLTMLSESVEGLHSKVMELARPSQAFQQSTLEFIQKVLLETYHCKSSFMRLLHFLMGSNDKKLWDLTYKAMNDCNVIAALDNPMELCNKWLESSLHYRMPEENHLTFAYKFLHIILGTQLVKDKPQLKEQCEKWAREYCQQFAISDFFCASLKVKEGFDLFLSHSTAIIVEKVRRTIEDGYSLWDSIQPLIVDYQDFGKSVEVTCRTTVGLLKPFLEEIAKHVNQFDNKVEKLIFLLKERRIWTSLFQATGEMSDELLNSDPMKEVGHLCELVRYSIINKEILTREVLEIKEHVNNDDMINLLQVVKTDKNRSHYRTTLTGAWNELVSDLDKFKEMCQETEDLLTFLYSFNGANLNTSRIQALELLERLKLKAGEDKINDILQRWIWMDHKLYSLQELASKHKHLLKLVTFSNFVDIQIKRCKLSAAEGISICDFASQLLEKCRKEYEEFMENHLVKGNDVDIDILVPVFRDVDSKEELSALERYFNKSCHQTFKESLLLWNKKTLLRKQGHKVQDLLKLLKLDFSDIRKDMEKLNGYIRGTTLPTSHRTLLMFHKHLSDTLSYLDSMDQDVADIITSLASSEHLVAFLTEILIIGLPDLMSVFEEHAEDFINATTVRALVDVQKFLQPLLPGISSNTITTMKDVITHLSTALEQQDSKEMVKKVDHCACFASSLKHLRNTVKGRDMAYIGTTVALLKPFPEEIAKHVNQFDNKVEKLIFLLKERRIWTSLFQATGEMSDELLNSDPMIEVGHLCESVTYSIINKEILTREVLEIKQHVNNDDMINLLQVVKTDKNRSHYRTTLTGAWNELVSDLDKFKEMCQETEDLLTFLYSFNGANLNTSRIQALELLERLKLKAGEDKINDILQRWIWMDHKLHSLQELASKHKHLLKLVTFSNFVDIQIKRCKLSATEGISICDFATQLLEKWRNEYEEFMENHLVKGNDVDIEMIVPVFRDVDSKKELIALERYFNKSFHQTFRESLILWTKKKLLRKQGHKVQGLLKLLKLDFSDIRKDMKKLNGYIAGTTLPISDRTLLMFHKHLSDTLSYLDSMDQDVADIINSLASSEHLVAFLTDILIIGLPDLMSVVEEHAEDFINATTVRALVDVQKFLQPLLQGISSNTITTMKDVITHLSTALKQQDSKEMVKKVDHCACNASSLKNLRNTLKGRKLVTKEFVKKVMQSGIVRIKSKSGNTEIVIIIKENEESMLEYLNEVRSRVLLLSNKSSLEDNQLNFMKFVDVVDTLNDIRDLLDDLHMSGIIEMQNIEEHITESNGLLESLQDVKANWENELRKWNKRVKVVRERHFLVNFIFGEQFRELHKLSKTKQLSSKVESIIRFILPDIDACDIDGCVQKQQSKADDHEPLNAIAFFLDKLSKINKIKEEKINCVQKSSQDKSHHMNRDDRPQLSNNLPIMIRAHYSLESAVPVILEIYREKIPPASDILFCQKETTIEEVELFIQRCYSSEAPLQYCLVNIHLLDILCQHQVFSLLQSNTLLKSNTATQLYVIYKGSHSYVHTDQKQENIKESFGLTREEQKQFLGSNYPHIFTVTSNTAGLGKTEYIHHLAATRRLPVHTLVISGQMNRKTLIQKLLKFQNMENKLLHINIKDVDDKTMLDNFIFELSILKCVSAGPCLAYLAPNIIAIEIENTLCNVLQNSLTTVTSFQRTHLKWENFANFIVSDETFSSGQMALQYMHLDNEKQIDYIPFILGNMKLRHIDTDEKIKLLRTYCDRVSPKNFSTVNSFLQILGEQLKHFSRSDIFKPANVRNTVGPKLAMTIRSELFRAMLQVAEDFIGNDMPQNLTYENKSIHECMIEKAKYMKKWEDSNHFIAMFNSEDCNALTPLYRDVNKVPEEIKRIFEVQTYKPLRDMDKSTQSEMRQKLEMIACPLAETREQIDERLGSLASLYSLTTDNVLKMALILLRIKSRIPVILMGDTGCGKTTLVEYLALTAGSKPEVINLHAGTSEEDLKKQISNARQKAKQKKDKSDIWVFFDEINTCDHLGVLSEILCHRTYYGEQLEDNIAFLAACNPYKLRNKDNILSSGLLTKHRKHDPQSLLVYRVHPLPEAMSDFVWDYGSLRTHDERSYIEKMLNKDMFPDKLNSFVDKIVNMVIISHDFLRNEENSSSCVSLRDVSRFRSLIPWYYCMLKEKSRHKLPSYNGADPDSLAFCITVIALGLSQCYGSKISKQQRREIYWKKMAKVIYSKESLWETLIGYVEIEQSDILNRLILPRNIAKTTCLKENVFSLFCCLMNKIPIFLLGKPGCSKSLSVQLLKSNLRGKDSKDTYFQTLKQLFVVPYQSSRVATSEEIENVFAVAKRYTSDTTILPVVLLDEIGLAETSPYNPLKALHSLLDTHGNKALDVAVIGISNWALDAAKMNRAIHMSVPDLNFDDLVEAATCFVKMAKPDDSMSWIERINEEGILETIAKRFLEYQTKDQILPNFHGARDFYGLIMYITNNIRKIAHGQNQKDQFRHIVLNGVQRNLGGIAYKETDIFMSKLGIPDAYKKRSIEELITENIKDSNARHLMVIYEEESMDEFLINSVEKRFNEYELLVGSNFESDYSDSYIYMILSKIIICMEKGIKLFLKDLDGVYGSLYDMLNQSYTEVGKSRRCRISLGANTNPGCEVHDDFKCIVLMQRKDLPLSDPPFLNRFEKQYLHHDSFLSEEEVKIADTIDKWVKNASNIAGKQFTVPYVFPGYNIEIGRSLIARLFQRNCDNRVSTCIMRGKKLLLQTTPPDAILRLSVSSMAINDLTEVRKLQKEYFENSITLKGFKKFLQHNLSIFKDSRESSTGTGLQLGVYTHSSVCTNVEQPATDVFDGKVFSYKLNQFKSEKQLALVFNKFVSTSDHSLLILQIQPTSESQHISLAKHLLKQSLNKQVRKQHKKHVCFILHLDKLCDYKNKGWQFSYFDKWNIFTVDRLEGTVEDFDVKDILSSDVAQLLQPEGFHNITDSIKRNFEWAFCCLNYVSSQEVEPYRKEELKDALEIPFLINFLSEKILCILGSGIKKVFDPFSEDNWQVELASSARGIIQGIPLFMIWSNYLESEVQIILTHIVYQIEKESAWFCLLSNKNNESLQKTWFDLAQEVIQIDAIHFTTDIGPKALDVIEPQVHFKIPFCRMLIKELHPVILEMKHDILDEEELSEIYIQHENVENKTECLVTKYLSVINRCLSGCKIGAYVKEHIQDFIDDLYMDLTSVQFQTIEDNTRIFICKEVTRLDFTEQKPYAVLSHALASYTENEVGINVIMSMVKQSQSFTPLPNHWFVKKDNTENRNDIATFISSACECILPSKLDNVNSFQQKDNTEKWLQQTATFLSCVNKVDKDIFDDIFLAELLKVFHDLIDLVYLPYSLFEECHQHLKMLEEAALQVRSREGNIFSNEKLLMTMYCIYNNLKTKQVNRKELDKFMCLFFGRCVSNNNGELQDKKLDICVIQNMLSCMQEMGDMDKSQYVGVVIHQIVYKLESELLQLLEEHLNENINIKTNQENIYIIALNTSISHDANSSWDILVCDILHKETFCHDNWEEDCPFEMEHEVWFDRYLKASSMTSKSTDFPLKCIINSAFVKSYTEWLGKQFQSHRSLEFPNAMESLNKRISEWKTDVVGLYVHFLQSLKSKGLQSLVETCDGLKEELHVLQDVEWTDSTITTTNIDPFVYPECASDMSIIDNMKGGCVVESVFAYIGSKYFLPRYHKLNDSDQTNVTCGKVRKFIENLPLDSTRKDLKHQEQYKKKLLSLGKCMMGDSQFGCRLMNAEKSLRGNCMSLGIFLVRLSQLYLTRLPHKPSPFLCNIIMTQNICDTSKLFDVIKSQLGNQKLHSLNLEESYGVLQSVVGNQDLDLEELLEPKCLFQGSVALIFVKKFVDLIWLSTILCGKSLEAEAIEGTHLVELWSDLQILTGCSESNFEIIIQILLYETRELFTDQYGEDFILKLENIIVDILKDKHKHILNYKQKMFRNLRMHEDSVEQLVEETTPNIMRQECMFRHVELPSILTLKSEVIFSQNCSFLEVLISMEKHILLLPHLPNILKWLRIVQQFAQRIMTKNDAESKTVDSLLKRKSKKTMEIDNAFNQFVESWNSLAEGSNMSILKTLLSNEKETVWQLPRLHGQKYFYDCVIAQNGYANNIIFKVIQALKRIQNTFLVNVVKTCRDNNATVKKVLTTSKCMQIHGIQRQHIVHLEWKPSLLNYSQNSTQFSNGCQIFYDLITIESEMAMSMLSEKPILLLDTTKFPFLIFREDVDHPCGKLLHKTRRHLKQESLPNDTKHQVSEMIKQSETDALRKLINILQILFVSLSESSVKQDESESANSYLQKRFSESYDIGDTLKLFSSLTDLKLSHVVSLYEYLEEKIAVQWEESIDDSYKCKLDKVSIDELTTLLERKYLKDKDDITLEHILHAFQKVVVRHIFTIHSFSKHRDTTDNLADLFADPYVWYSHLHTGEKGQEELWNKDVFPRIQEHLPRSLAVKNVIEAVKFVRNYVQKQNEKEEAPINVAKKELLTKKVATSVRGRKKAKKENWRF